MYFESSLYIYNLFTCSPTLYFSMCSKNIGMPVPEIQKFILLIQQWPRKPISVCILIATLGSAKIA